MTPRRVGACFVVATALGAASATASDSLSVDSVRGRFGAKPAEALLGVASVEARVRGIERLGSLGTPRAQVRLIQVLTPGTIPASAEEQLTAVRALARFTGESSVRRALASVVSGQDVAGKEKPPALRDVVRRTAALLLARSRDPDAVTSLGRFLSAAGRTAEIATEALIAEPPLRADVLMSASKPSVALVQVLEGAFGRRAGRELRELVRTGAPVVRAEAALALFRLRDAEVTALARRWASDGRDPDLSTSAARILSARGDALGRRAARRLLDDPKTVDAAISVLSDFPDPGSGAALAAQLPHADAARTTRLLIAIGRAGGAEAARVLENHLQDASLALRASEALARMRGREATDALGRALTDDRTRRMAVRACVFRRLVFGEVPSGFDRAIRDLARSPNEDDRVVGSLAKAVRDSETAWAFSRPPLWLSLSDPVAASSVPTADLLAHAEPGEAESLVAIRELSRRDDERLRARLLEGLSSKDPLVRAHVALGLGSSNAPDATGVLATAWTFEADGLAREAMTRGLSLRSADEARDRALATIGDLDPDRGVRALAQQALHGERLEPEVRGHLAAWIRVLDAEGKPAPRGTKVQLSTAGVSLPFVAGPDGVVVAAGLANGPIHVRVAPGYRTVNDGR